MIAALALGYVTIARLVEMVIARRNTAALVAAGAVEYGARHYPFILVMHVAWLLALWTLAWGQPVHWVWLALFALLQPLRIWVFSTLGARWSARVLVVPGETLVRTGPYRWLRHPNYWIVVGEIASLPLAFGLVWVALLFSALNAIALGVRVRVEDAALADLR